MHDRKKHIKNAGGHGSPPLPALLVKGEMPQCDREDFPYVEQ